MCYDDNSKKIFIKVYSILRKIDFNSDKIRSIFKTNKFPSHSTIYEWKNNMNIENNNKIYKKYIYKKYTNVNITPEIEIYIYILDFKDKNVKKLKNQY
jgi:hypothetical protein